MGNNCSRHWDRRAAVEVVVATKMEMSHGYLLGVRTSTSSWRKTLTATQVTCCNEPLTESWRNREGKAALGG